MSNIAQYTIDTELKIYNDIGHQIVYNHSLVSLFNAQRHKSQNRHGDYTHTRLVLKRYFVKPTEEYYIQSI